MKVMGKWAKTEAPYVPVGEIDSEREGGAVLLDVRTSTEIALTGRARGAVHIRLAELESRIDELPRDRPILTA